ncbi:MAG: beta-ketoacyl-ACP synthase III [Lachnospiraceae bacterium]|nr:beta-ketoacyl-ACP synthase III [Lachnospiraceae bacterium]
MNGLKIVGLGHFVPENVYTNDEISKNIETDDEWIRTRTGIEERRFVGNDETNYSLAVKAADMAIKNAGVSKDDISYIITCTFSADFPVPSIACMVQSELEIGDSCTCFDINAACSGFLYGLHTVRGLLLQEKDKNKYGLVIGSEVISRHLDMNDRETCILFGDGAGAAVVKLEENYLYEFTSGSKGNYEVLHVGALNEDKQYVGMKGKDVFKFAVTTIPKCINNVLNESNLSIDDIDYVVCHQANKRIIEAVMTKYKQPAEKFPMNIMKYGNTSAASIPIMLSEMNEKGMFKKGQKVILVGFGAGLTWAANLIEI